MRGRPATRGFVVGGFLLALAGAGGAASGPAAAAGATNGYVLVDTAGIATGFGDAVAAGSLSSSLNAPIVDGDMTPTGAGHVLVGADGGVFAFGDAPYFGGLVGTPLNAPIVGVDVTPTGLGYILAGADGGVFAFGDAPFSGSLGGMALNGPVVDIALNTTNDGYRLTASDGGVFAFGNSPFAGSMAGAPLNSPVTGIMSDKAGPGYALVAEDGGFFAFGGFAFRGSLGGMALNAPIVDAVLSPTGDGYHLVGKDGGVFAFGDAPFAGSLAGAPLPRPIVTLLGLANASPVAADDAYNAVEDTALVVGAASGVLGDDSDGDGDALTAVVATQPANGAVTMASDGSFTYTPAANFSGADTFTYTASDPYGGTDTGTVTVTVAGVNDAPNAVDDAAGAGEDGPVVVDVLGNDTDADPIDTKTVSAVTTGTSTIGAVTNNGTNVSYDPNGQFESLAVGETATDTFTYTVSDSGGAFDTAVVTVTITGVNDTPTADDDAASAGENGPAVTVDVLNGDTDPDSTDVLSVSGVSAPGSGTATITNGGADVSYDPNGQFEALDTGEAGSDTFSYTVADGNGGTDTGDVTMTIDGANDAPSATAVSDSTTEDTAKAVTLTGSDVDVEALTFSIVTGPTNGSLGAIGSVTCGATCTASVTYTPDADYNGADSFTYRVNDGTVDSSAATVSLTVTAVNDLPVAVDDAYQTNKNVALTVAAPGVLANDSDADGPTPTAGNASDPANGAVTLNADGSFTYTPDTGFTGADTFTYDVTDGAATDTGLVTIAVNTPPTADATSAGGNEDSSSITVNLAGDDADGDALTFSVGAATNGVVGTPGSVTCTGATPNHCTATVTYTPNADFNGGDSFTYTVNDGTVDSAAATATITVTAVNDAPSFTLGADQAVLEDSGAQTVPGWATGFDPGPDNESTQNVTVERVSTSDDPLFSALPEVAADGTLTYTPAADANGTATVTLRAKDDGGTANGGVDTGSNQTFTITVTAVNDAPSFTKGGDQNLSEDAGAQSVSNWATLVSEGAANESAQSLTFVIDTNSNAGLFSAGPAVSDTGTLTFTTAANRYGVANITLHLEDDGGTANGGDNTSAAATFTITVNAVNDAPTAAAKAFTVQANMKISLGTNVTTPDNLLVGATDTNDVAGDATWSPSFTLGSITVGAGCTGCTVSNVDNANGTFDFDPPAGGTGTYTLNYTVVDNGHPTPGATSAAQTITMTVNGPVIWFVDTAATGAETGRLSAPFNTLAEATTAMGSSTNHRIFVTGGNVTGNVTLQTDGWLISEAATGASFDAVMGFTPPAGTIARPSVNGTQRTLTGTVTLGTNSVVRGFDLTPASGSAGLVASGKAGLTVNQLSVTTTNARAVDLSSSSGTFNLKKVSATGADRGISLTTVNTSSGSFTVTGDGSTAGSGGTITGSTADGSLAVPEGGIYLNDTKNVSLAWITVHDSDSNGIYGANVTTFTLADSTISDNGTNHVDDHSGIQFDNLLGTSSMARITVFGSYEHNVIIENSSGTANLTLSDSTIRDNTTTFGSNGFYVNATGSASVTFTSTSNSFLRNRSTGLQVFAQSSQRLTANITGGTYVQNGGGGLNMSANGTGGLQFSVNGGTVDGCATCLPPVNVIKNSLATGANALVGTINGMTVTNDNSDGATGIWVHGVGVGETRIAVTNNNVSQVAQYGIAVTFGEGGPTADVTVTGNTVNLPSNAAVGIFAESGTLSADTSTLCADIRTNTVTLAGADNDIVAYNHRPATTLRLPGFTGSGTDTAAVAAYLKGRNTAADAFAFLGTDAAFSGGNPTTCAAP